MTKRQREALKYALEYLKGAEREKVAWMGGNMKSQDYQRVLDDYGVLVAHMQTIEEMIRGEQKELGI